jgi:hypothetical protein
MRHATLCLWVARHTSTTIPAENRSDIARIAISNNGRMLLSVDVGTWVLPLHARTPWTPLLGLIP